MLKNCLLPPKSGYVETEINGVRKYKNAVTGVLMENETVEPDEVADLQELTLSLAVRLSMLENGVTNQ